MLLQLSVFFQHEENEQCSAQHFLRGGLTVQELPGSSALVCTRFDDCSQSSPTVLVREK